jgi:NADH-quinone oxidoreductase subunit E
MNLKQDTLTKIDALIGKYPEKRSALIMILHLVQDDIGCLNNAAMEWVAQRLEITPMQVYEVVTFYPMFHINPLGKKHIKVCRTLPCALRGSYDVCEKLQQKLRCPLGQTSPDGEFTVEFVECLANCHTAPIVVVDEQMYENITPEKVETWIRETLGVH